MNPFTQDPVTHPNVTWQDAFTSDVQPFRIRILPTEEDTIAVLGMNGVIQQYSFQTGKSLPLVATGGQPTDLTVVENRQTIVTDVSWNNLMAVKDASVHGLMDQDSGIHFPLAVVNLNGYVYFSDQSGLYSFSSDGLLQKLAEQSGITALTVAHQCVMLAVNGENAVKCLRPGFEPVTYCSGFFGAFRLVDMTTGPNQSLLVATEAVSRGEEEGACGYLYVVSACGLPSACVELPGVPQSICYMNGKILLAVAESKVIYQLPTTVFV
ncbi:Conserved_hypothetical protein [Hexamita inflata]|uniref:Uncharacterized protein n=1 Tax=Hexamita inflata TaxID=28002 RepID=A0AA86U650_9EUKA|nr:Conserved hypothetical protein [Hexamita inflata]CAI9963630.1 Conserved hypothetical protein [Hexamita inflata]